VSITRLPESPDAFRDAPLEEIESHYRELAERPLDDVEQWLADWSRLEELLQETVMTAIIEYDCDTKDEEKERVSLRLTSEIAPELEKWSVKLGDRLLESGYSRSDLKTALERFRNRTQLFREENVPLVAELERLGSEYRKLVGAMTVEWEGEQLSPPQVRPFAASGDRDVRERAFRAYFSGYVEHHDEMAAIYDQMLEARARMARNAGFDNYRDYGHRSLNRFDYTPDDCLRLHAAVEEHVTPAVGRINRRRAELIGLDSGLLKPWDALDSHVATPDPLGRPAVTPFSTQQELVQVAQRVFERVDPNFGEQFGQLIENEVLDLMSRPGKGPGAFCAMLPVRRLPFLFENASGVSTDVDTLLHESGHAFHAFETMAHLPLIFQWEYGSEIAEVASMGMELLARPYLRAVDGGFYSEEDYRRIQTDHLEEILVSLGHMAAVDAFQHWVYTQAGVPDAAARDAYWVQLRDRFETGIDWSGCEAERIARWYEQSHFFLYPLYYVEYALAQLGALQVWRNAQSDHAGAVAAYRRALQLGGSRPLPELYAAAGAELVFSADKLAPLVEFVEGELDRLRA
jgi:oligoendopeptidase F